MGYTILYGRQFIKTTRGIIPLALAGSSNCYESRPDNRWVRERSWDRWYYNQMVELPAEEIMAIIHNLHDNKNTEQVKQGSKWLHDADMIKWFENGIKNALTIEEIINILPRQYLDCHITTFDDNGSTRTLQAYVRTTPELEAWIDKVKRLAPNNERYMCIGFEGQKPLHIEYLSHIPDNVPVVITHGKSYLNKMVPDESCSYSSDISKAIIYPNKIAAYEAIAQAKIFGPFGLKVLKESKPPVEKSYVIRIAEGARKGYYINKLTSHALYYAYSVECAKKFISQKEAIQWIEKYSITPTRFTGLEKLEVVNTKGE